MKRSLVLLALILMPTQALAWLKVVNASSEVQYVTFDSAGSATTKAIAVGDHVFFPGADGMLSIDVSKQTVKATDAEVGALSGILGNVAAGNRTNWIPARNDDVFVIWPNGRLLFQQRQRGRGAIF